MCVQDVEKKVCTGSRKKKCVQTPIQSDRYVHTYAYICVSVSGGGG
jgi:hypothetical protein